MVMPPTRTMPMEFRAAARVTTVRRKWPATLIAGVSPSRPKDGVQWHIGVRRDGLFGRARWGAGCPVLLGL